MISSISQRMATPFVRTLFCAPVSKPSLSRLFSHATPASQDKRAFFDKRMVRQYSTNRNSESDYGWCAGVLVYGFLGASLYVSIKIFLDETAIIKHREELAKREADYENVKAELIACKKELDSVKNQLNDREAELVQGTEFVKELLGK